ncbi:MAG: type IV secretion protein IcmB [Gammaproteobacteria bacterium]
MATIVDKFFDNVDSFIAWFSSSIKTSCDDYCEIETADREDTLVARDGSLISVIKIEGVTHLLGNEEFDLMHEALTNNFRTALSRPGHSVQMVFTYDRATVRKDISDKLAPARSTAERLELDLNDLFQERVNYISQYCASESVYMVLWTRPFSLSGEQQKRAQKEKLKFIKDNKIPPVKNAQNTIAAIPDVRNTHESFVRSLINDLTKIGMLASLLKVHDAVHVMRQSVDPEFTSHEWKAVLPGDSIPMRDMKQRSNSELSGVMYPPLAKQIFPRDAEILDLRTVRIGDRIYSPIFIDLFPQEIRSFVALFNRTLPTQIPWRISFLLDSNGLSTIRFKAMVASILSFASQQNHLISDAAKMLQYIDTNTDDPVIRLRVALTTWAPEGNIRLLRTRTAELAKAVQGWGNCDTSEVSGDVFGGIVSSHIGVSSQSYATPTVAPLSDAVFMLPFSRPATVWRYGSVMFRTPDGKPWPFQPGSAQQTTWIDLLYARPGSGKSVLSNALNLGLCLSAGIRRLPRIAIIDIGPSSSGLISLLREALPKSKRHLVAYHRLRMTPEYSINPFDTQLGCRFPTPQERSFLVNFITLLATPLGATKPYDGVSDMAGLVVDELFKTFADDGKPRLYSEGLITEVDDLLSDIGFVRDAHTTWWEITDALFTAGFAFEASLAQRYAMPLLADAASICRTSAIEDLFGQVITPTGETLVKAFGRMISSAVREYPILSTATQFAIGDSRIVSLDLDEVAKSGGDAADRQTAVMYMLARYVLANHYYLTNENVSDMPETYRAHHKERIDEIREDAKRIVFDEFHRTSKASAVRDQVVVDMREGRKWNVQIALISQSVEDFDPVMIEFATSVYIMDAGPAQAIARTTEIFGLTETAATALRTRVHGPREGGSTFLAQFATKQGINTQLLTATIGPVELWAFSTTAEDATVRNKLYEHLGPKEARRVLARLFPSGSIKALVEERMAKLKEDEALIEDLDNMSIAEELVREILEAHAKNPDVQSLN